MSFSKLKRLNIGLSGVDPGILFLKTDLTNADVSVTGYLNTIAPISGTKVNNGDMLLANASDGSEYYTVVVAANGQITLEAAGGSVVPGAFDLENVFFVASNGDNSNSGMNSNKPLQTLTAAIAKIAALVDPTTECLINIMDAGVYTGNYTLPTNCNIVIAAHAASIVSNNTSPIFTMNGGTFSLDCYFLNANGAFNPIFAFSGTTTVNVEVQTSSFGILNLVPTVRFNMTVLQQLAGDINVTSNGDIVLVANAISGDITDTSTLTAIDGHISINANSVTGSMSSTNTQINGWVKVVNTGTVAANSIAQGFFNGISYGITPGAISTFANFKSISGTTQLAVINNGYINDNASLTTITLPATAPEGVVVAVQGHGTGGWRLQANTGQTIHYYGVNTSVAGSLSSTGRYDSIEIVCVVADTEWAVSYAGGSGLVVA